MREACHWLRWRRTGHLEVHLLQQVDDLDVVEAGDILVLLVEVLFEAVVGDLAVVDGGQRVDVLDLVGCNGVAVRVVFNICFFLLLLLSSVGILLQPSKLRLTHIWLCLSIDKITECFYITYRYRYAVFRIRIRNRIRIGSAFRKRIRIQEALKELK
jgi:hypothetical protein